MGVNVETSKLGDLFVREVVRVDLCDAELLEAALHDGRKVALAVLALGAEAVEKSLHATSVRLQIHSEGQHSAHLVLLRRLVEHARVNGGRQQVVGSRDRVDITG